MAQSKGAVLPIVKKIQTNLTRRLEAKVDNQGDVISEVGEKIDTMQGLMHYHLGMTTEQQHQIATIQKQIKDLQGRVAALEGERS